MIGGAFHSCVDAHAPSPHSSTDCLLNSLSYLSSNLFLILDKVLLKAAAILMCEQTHRYFRSCHEPFFSEDIIEETYPFFLLRKVESLPPVWMVFCGNLQAPRQYNGKVMFVGSQVQIHLDISTRPGHHNFDSNFPF